MSGFELWDVKSTKRVGDYDTEHQALKAGANVVRLSGSTWVEHLALVWAGPRGSLTRLAAGAELAKRASVALSKRVDLSQSTSSQTQPRSSSHSRIRVHECDIHFIYAADGGRHLQLDKAYIQLKNTPRWADNCQIERDPSVQTHEFSDPLYTLVRHTPVVLKIDSYLEEVPLGDSYRKRVPLSTRVTLHGTCFLSVRLSLILKDIDLDCIEVARAEMLNQTALQISCPVLGPLSLTLDEYSWKLFDNLERALELNPRVPSNRPKEVERVLVLRQLSGDPDAEDLLTNHALDMAAMVARLKWYIGQSRQFTQDMIDDALVLHKYLLVLCKWQGKLIYYSNRLPEDVRAWWKDTDIVNTFELLMIQFFAARMYNVCLEEGRLDAQRALDTLAKSNGSLLDVPARSSALASLLRVEAVRAEVELAVYETENSLVSLSHMILQVIERYDRAIRLTDKFDVVRKKLEMLERLNDVIVRTLGQQTNEALLEANLKMQKEAARERRILRVLTLLLLVLTVLAVPELLGLASQIMTSVIDLVNDVMTYIIK